MAIRSRVVGISSRSLRPRKSTLCVNAAPNAKRYMAVAADSNALSQHDNLPASMAMSSQHTSARNEPDTSNELDLNEVRPPRAVQLAYLRPLKRTAKHRIPTCNLQLRSYSVQNLEFFTTFALRAAYFLNLPAVGPIPLPKQIERWTVPKGHFIHKKSQENFERITLRRLIQIQDGHPETIQMWLAYLRKRSYYGVGMKANVWTFEKLGLGRKMDIAAENGQSLEQRWKSQFSPQATPGTQAEIDTFLENHNVKSGEEIPLSIPEDLSSQGTRTSLNPRIKAILEQVEREAAEAAENTSESLEAQTPTAKSSSSAEASEEQEAVSTPEPEPVKVDATLQPETTSATEVVANAASVPTTVESASSQESATQGKELVEELPNELSASSTSEMATAENSSSLESGVVEGSESSSEPQSATDLPADAISASGTAESASSAVLTPTKRTTTNKATKSTTKRGTKSASKSTASSEEVKPPQPSDVDTSKDVSTPEEADPSVEPQTEKAKEAESEDAKAPLGDLPKTPS